MARYIDADVLIKRLTSAGAISDWGLYLIKDEPAADVRLMTHSYWKPIFDTYANKERGFAIYYECSECGCISRDCTYSRGLDYEFCPNCGAKMYGEGSENND